MTLLSWGMPQPESLPVETPLQSEVLLTWLLYQPLAESCCPELWQTSTHAILIMTLNGRRKHALWLVVAFCFWFFNPEPYVANLKKFHEPFKKCFSWDAVTKQRGIAIVGTLLWTLLCWFIPSDPCRGTSGEQESCYGSFFQRSGNRRSERSSGSFMSVLTVSGRKIANIHTMYH